MKLSLLSFFIFFSSLGYAQVDPPVRFEADTSLFMLVDFGGNASSVMVDPTDATNNVAQSIKTDVAELWAGTTIGMDGFENPLAFAPGSTIMTVRVWSPDANTPIRLKVEDHTDPTISVETETNTTMAGAWETLSFDFSNEVTGTAAINFANTYDKASIFFNFGTTGADAGAKTYYWDDVEFVPGMANLLNLPVTFEGDTATFDLVDFGGNASAFEVDPTDPTNNVARSTKMDIAELWAGTTIGADGFATPIPFTSDATTMTVRVWSPDAGVPVRLKVEDASDATISVETETMTTMAGAWETMEFDFGNEVTGTAALNLANNYNKASIFFNFGTTGADAGEKTYYWDDVQFVEGMSPSFNLPVPFEADTMQFALVDFGGNASAFEVDPTDPTNNVARSTKTDIAELWAGTTLGVDGFTDAIPFTATATKMSIRVWSPDAGIPVRLKVEDSNDATISVETETMTTMAGAWETMEFDFSNEVSGTAALNLANNYNKASIFFNFGTTGADAGEKTYYWDDVEFLEGVAPSFNLPVPFEADTMQFALVDFGGNASAFEVDPTDPTNNVARSTKTDIAELWAGTTLGVDGFTDAIPFTATATKMSIRVWSPDAGIPVRLKVEDSNDATISVETETMTTMAGAWETMEFDFSNEVTGTAALNLANSYNKASVFFNFGTTGADAGEKTYYWDDVEFVEEMAPAFNLPVPFETDTALFDLVDFGGNSSAFEVDPTDPTNNVARSTKTDVAELWAGTTLGLNGFTNAIPFTATETKMSIRVWSPDAGIPVRLKVEDSSDATISVETETMTTMAGAWEIMDFDFSNEVTGTAALNLANSYNKASVFFNFGTTGADAGEKTYYWDDVKFGSGNSGNRPLAASAHNIDIFPNPTTDMLHIDFPDQISEEFDVKLFDLTGRLMINRTYATDQVSLNVENMTAGSYVLIIETSSNRYAQKILVK